MASAPGISRSEYSDLCLLLIFHCTHMPVISTANIGQMDSAMTLLGDKYYEFDEDASKYYAVRDDIAELLSS